MEMWGGGKKGTCYEEWQMHRYQERYEEEDSKPNGNTHVRHENCGGESGGRKAKVEEKIPRYFGDPR